MRRWLRALPGGRKIGFSLKVPLLPTDMFTAIRGGLVGEDRATPRIEQLIVTSPTSACWPIGGRGGNQFIGAEEDPIRNIHGIVKAAGLDGEEMGFILGQIANLKRVECGEAIRPALCWTIDKQRR